jgi:hypothetical protein
MTPDRVEAAAGLLESLAADPSNAKFRAEAACCLLFVPMPHPLRGVHVLADGVEILVDEVQRFAEEIQHGRGKQLPREPIEPDEMRAFAARLRAGKAEMMATGWWPTMHATEPATWSPA